MNVFGPKSIKHYVDAFLAQRAESLRGQTWVDVPAGSGHTSAQLLQHGANVLPIDLFPDLFRVEGLTCVAADIMQGLPLEDAVADGVICQEGMEHFNDQLAALREFNRVLRPGGRLVLTTPNYSSIHARLSYLLFESEYAGRLMPPNEIDTVWLSSGDDGDGVYFGHAFLTGIQRLRLLALASGFRLKQLHPFRVSKTALALLPIFYPFILIASLRTYFRARRKAVPAVREAASRTYLEQLRLNLSLRVLLDHKIFAEFEKVCLVSEVKRLLHRREQGCDFVT